MPGHRCGTPSRIHAARMHPKPVVPPRLGPIIEKEERQGFSGTFTSLASDNFAVHWQDASVTEANAQVVLDWLETSWVTYIDEMGHSLPTGTETYKLNAYISRATDTPDIDFSGGYADIDPGGYPYFVISRDMFESSDDVIGSIVTHEFYHDVQFSMDAYDRYDWYWEATAEWAAMQAMPGSPEPYVYVGPYFLRGQLPLFYYGNFNDDFVPGVHQYGAAIFFKNLTDKLGARDSVVQSWELGDQTAEPLGVLFMHAGTETLESAFADLAKRAAFIDFPLEERAAIDSSMEDFSEDGHPDEERLAAYIPAEGQVATMAMNALYSYGFAVLEVARPPSGRMNLTLALMNTLPTSALHAAMAVQTNAGVEYTDLAVTGLESTTELAFPDGIAAVRVVVWATSDERRTGRQYFLTTAATPVVEEPSDDGSMDGDDMVTDGDDTMGPDDGGMTDDDGGCCRAGSSGGGAATSTLFVVLGLVALRRARRKS